MSWAHCRPGSTVLCLPSYGSQHLLKIVLLHIQKKYFKKSAHICVSLGHEKLSTLFNLQGQNSELGQSRIPPIFFWCCPSRMLGIPAGRRTEQPVQHGPSQLRRASAAANGTGPGQVPAVPAIATAGGVRARLPSRLSLGSGRAAGTADRRVSEPGVGWGQRAAPSGSAGRSQPSPRATPATRGMRAGRAAAAMGEGGGRQAAEPESFSLELGRERRKQ